MSPVIPFADLDSFAEKINEASIEATSTVPFIPIIVMHITDVTKNISISTIVYSVCLDSQYTLVLSEASAGKKKIKITASSLEKIGMKISR